MHIMSTNFAKTLFGDMNMTSNYDVTNSTHQMQMTTICHWMKPPRKIFAYATDLEAKTGMLGRSCHLVCSRWCFLNYAEKSWATSSLQNFSNFVWLNCTFLYRGGFKG